MRAAYAYFVLHCQTFYAKSGRFSPLESALYCASFIFVQLSISVGVVASKILETSPGKFILLALVAAFVFQVVQRRLISSSFLTKYALKFEVERKRNWHLILVMITPSLVLAVGLLVVLVLLH